MLADILRKICANRGIAITPSPTGPFGVKVENGWETILWWDESVLGLMPSQKEIDAIDSAALQAEIEAEEKAAAEIAELMKTLPEKYKTLQASYDALSAQLSAVKMDVATSKAAR